MDLATFQQRLKKYTSAILDIKEQGEISTITYEGVKLSGKKYGPLWDLFKRYKEDKITEKDVDNIEILEYEVEDTTVVSEEKTFELSEEQENLIKLFEANISKKVKIKYSLYKAHTNDVTGIISKVHNGLIDLYDIQGAARVVAIVDVIEYRFAR